MTIVRAFPPLQGLALLAALCLMSFSASAAVLNGEVRGIITGGIDSLAIFGSAEPGAYVGLPFLATFKVDLESAPEARRDLPPEGTVVYRSEPPPHWIYDLALTVNGVSFTGFVVELAPPPPSLPLSDSTNMQEIFVSDNVVRNGIMQDAVRVYAIGESRRAPSEEGSAVAYSGFLFDAIDLTASMLGSGELHNADVQSFTIENSIAFFSFIEEACTSQGGCDRATEMVVVGSVSRFSLVPVPLPPAFAMLGLGMGLLVVRNVADSCGWQITPDREHR